MLSPWWLIELFIRLFRMQEHKQAGSISLLKSDKLSSGQQESGGTSETMSTLTTTFTSTESDGHLTPLDSSTDVQESGTSTPSHNHQNHQTKAVSMNIESVDPQDLVDALHRKLGLNSTQHEESSQQRTITLTN